jgi:AmmeMemoRadiSam system protein B
MVNIRKPNVAGQFYPDQTKVLSEMINKFLSEVHVNIKEKPKAIIVPHAGYTYSGPIAATAYATLLPYKESIKKVILLGPTHRMSFKGVAATMVDYFETPLGSIPIDHNIQEISSSQIVNVNETAYEMEHSIEVQLPFLQTVLNKFELLPLIVGDIEFIKVADIINNLWDSDETLIVVSSDLSHYKAYYSAQTLDTLTSSIIEKLAPNELQSEQVCGLIPIQGLLQVAKQKNIQVRTLDVRNSGDTSGSKENVVGYGAYFFW